MKNYNRKSSGKKRRILLALLVLLLSLICLSYLKLGVLLSSGREKAVDAKHALVLAGQSSMMVRSDQALRLLRIGRVEQIVLSSAQFSRGHFIAEPVCEDYKNQGLDENQAVVMLEHFATSTYQEAKDVIPYFVKQNVDTVLLVTNAFHASRAKFIFNSLSQGNPYFLVPDFNDPEYLGSDWARSRNTLKMSVMESLKWVLSFWEVESGGATPWGSFQEVPCVLKEEPKAEVVSIEEVESKVDSIDRANLTDELELENE